MHAPPLHPNGHVVSVCAYVHVPAEHVPVAAYVRRVVPLGHVAPGGALHVTDAHGSVAHAPPLQPEGHVITWLAYVQLPAEHVPTASYVFSSVPPLQLAAGALVHVTPAHGSPLHLPPAHPNGQLVGWLAYVHVPPAHEPTASYVVSSVPLVHFAAGALAHVTPTHGSVSAEVSAAVSGDVSLATSLAPSPASSTVASPSARGPSSSSPSTALHPAPSAPSAHTPSSHADRRAIARTSRRSSRSPRRRARS